VSILELDGISTYYGPVCAVRDVSFSVEEGETIAILGANGAGKTTLMRTIAGLQSPREGRIRYDGRELTKVPAHARAIAGLVLAPEGRGLFRRLTVEENLRLGGWGRGKAVAAGVAEMLERFPRLKERRSQIAGSLSGGEQQMLCVARAMMRDPKVLLLDEPSMGLAPAMVAEIYEMLRELKARNVTLLVVEQNVGFALELASRGYVLTRGQVAMEGTVKELRNDPSIFDAYLGGEHPGGRQAGAIGIG
jgi:branched-chain amino acid transport system ATP-binding protein